MGKLYLRIVRAERGDPTQKLSGHMAFRRFEILSEEGVVVGELSGVMGCEISAPLDGLWAATVTVAHFAEDFEPEGEHSDWTKGR